MITRRIYCYFKVFLKGATIMSECAIIIPALNPNTSLIEYVKSLLKNGVAHIIVVNDGSKMELEHIFEELEQLVGCTVLIHEGNKGKGRALKTAFSYFLQHYGHLAGVVTADADGQHSVQDVCKIADCLITLKEGMILGVRDFSSEGVPAKSLIGNRITSFFFRYLYGYRLDDTQTGLRGIKTKEIASILALKGERYEYEINMLIHARKRKVNIKQIPIETIYFNNNTGTYYQPFKDSVKVFTKLFSGLINFSLSTLLAGIVDISIFIILNHLLLSIFPLEIRLFLATCLARLISATSNFYMNRNHVFYTQNKLLQSITRYYTLCIGIMLMSYLLLTLSNVFLGTDVIIAKICIDILLGLISYKVQLHWVFNKQMATENEVYWKKEG
jgi:putative flippase GtrA